MRGAGILVHMNGRMGRDVMLLAGAGETASEATPAMPGVETRVGGGGDERPAVSGVLQATGLADDRPADEKLSDDTAVSKQTNDA